MKKVSRLEYQLELRLKAAGFPAPIREYKFCEYRRWRFDFCWPDKKIALECEGGIWLGKGGHTSGKGYSANCGKYNCAVLLGWKVLRYPPNLFYMLAEDLRKLIPRTKREEASGVNSQKKT